MRKNTSSAALVLLALLAPGALAARAQSIGELLERAIYKEETVGDVDGAIEIYKRVLEEAAASRSTGAQAQYRLALCYLKTGRTADAKAAFERVAAEYADQEDLASAARKQLSRLAPEPELLPVPWLDGEVLEYEAKLLGGMRIGAFVLAVESAQEDGRDAWRIGVRRAFATNPDNQGVSRVLVERDSLRPIQSEFHHGLLGDVEATYLSGAVSIVTRGREKVAERTIDVDGSVYDNEEVLHLVRRLPLAIGYETDLGVVVPFGTGLVPMTFAVTAMETITVPAGTFDCYRAEFSIGQTVWIANEAQRRMIRLDADGCSFELLAESRRAPGSAAPYRNEGFGIELVQPADWHFAVLDGKAGEYVALMLLDPRAEVRGVLELALYDESEVPTVEARAQAELEKAQKRFAGYTLRPESWTAGAVAGLPSIRFAGDYRDGDRAMVQDRHYVVGKGRVAEFIFKVPADRFQALEPVLAEIVASYRVP